MARVSEWVSEWFYTYVLLSATKPPPPHNGFWGEVQRAYTGKLIAIVPSYNSILVMIIIIICSGRIVDFVNVIGCEHWACDISNVYAVFDSLCCSFICEFRRMLLFAAIRVRAICRLRSVYLSIFPELY